MASLPITLGSNSFSATCTRLARLSGVSVFVTSTIDWAMMSPPSIVSGMTLAVEPMVNAGTHEVRVKNDGWTVVTLDGRLSAHYENSIAITESDPIVLTDVEN